MLRNRQLCRATGHTGRKIMVTSMPQRPLLQNLTTNTRLLLLLKILLDHEVLYSTYLQ